MESGHHDQFAFYKKFERECNKRIHAYTNCRTFTNAFGKAMESHLDRVMIDRKVINSWLKRLDLPTKDEIAAIAVRMVDYEEKIDSLDEAIYLLNRKQKENNTQLSVLRESLDEVLGVLEKEVIELHVCKLVSLETDLEDLKQLFTY